MAFLFQDRTANGASTGVAQAGATDVYAQGVFDGATITIEVSPTDGNYVKADNISVLKPSRLQAPGVCKVDGVGDYYIRAVLSNAGANTSITVTTT